MRTTYKAVIINGEDVLLLGNEEAEAATSGVLEGDTACLGSQDPIHVVPVVELVVEPLRHPNRLRRISVLYDYQMVWLEKWPPHLQEIQVPDGGNHYVQIVLQRRCHWNRRLCHGLKVALARK